MITHYRAMHYSAKRGIEIACRPSVRLSVRLSETLVDHDHIGGKSWKLIARTISPRPSLFVAQKPSTYSQENIGKFGETKDGVGKLACWSTKAAISLKSVKVEEKLLWRAYRNSPTLFRTVPMPTLYGLLFPKIGGLQPPKLQSLLSQDLVKLQTSNLADTFIGSIRTKAHEKFWEKRTVDVSRD